MSEERCPKCGAEFAYQEERGGWVHWRCLSCRDRDGRFRASYECLVRQLAQRDERIAELESDILLYRGRLEYLARTVVFDGPRMDLGGGLSSETLQTSSLEAVLAERAEAKAHLAAVKPLVRAAMKQEQAIRDAARGYGGLGFVPRGAAGIYCQCAEEAVRSLPAEERAWWEEA